MGVSTIQLLLYCTPFTTARGVPPDAIERLRRVLPSTFEAVFAPTLNHYAEALGLSSIQGGSDRRPYRYTYPEPVVAAELFVEGASLFVVALSKTSPENEIGGDDLYSLEAHFIGPTIDQSVVRQFAGYVNAATGVHVEPTRYGIGSWEGKSESGRTPVALGEAERSASLALADRGVRTLALAIKTPGSLLVNDLSRPLPSEFKESAADLHAVLQRENLVQSELVVICKRTQARVVRAPSRETLVNLATQGVKCVCGQRMADERVEEALTITEFGQGLLDSNTWLANIVVDELISLGVDLEGIRLESQTAGSEMDVIADLNGQVALFELKGKEFSLDNAYSFSAKIAVVKPAHAVIVTTDRVAADVKEHFRRVQAGARRRIVLDPEEPESTVPIYIEGLDAIKRGLEALVTASNAVHARRVIDGVIGFGTPAASAIVDALVARTLVQISPAPDRATVEAN